MNWLYEQIKRWLRPPLKAILLICYRSINREPLAVASKLPHAPRIIHLSIYKGVIFFGYHDKTPFSGDDSKILSRFTLMYSYIPSINFIHNIAKNKIVGREK